MTPEQNEMAEQLVKRDIIYCVSGLVYELAQKEEYVDDLMPVLSQPQYIHTFEYTCECGADFEKEENDPRAVELNDRCDDISTFTAECPECKKVCEPTEVNADETDPIEALEHWIVDSWLAAKLEEKGEMVVRDFLGLTIWGRTTSGQQISADGVIEEIAKETM